MMVGAYLLLFRGTRFVWEWALLVLPMLTQFAGGLKEIHGRKKYLSMMHLLMVVVMVLPFVTMLKRLPANSDYPFDGSNAPIAITRFLEHVGGSGNLFALPTEAGFLHWNLGPGIKVFADLQMSLFNDLDIYRVFSFYRTEQGMQRIIEKYQPDYISTGLKNKSAKISQQLLQARTDYVPVFSGDQQVLFVNKQLQPEVADRYQLKLVDPFSLAKLKQGADLDEHIAELTRMSAIFPESDRINHALTRLLYDAKRFEDALPWADKFVRYHPENPNSHMLLGKLYEEAKIFDKAIEHYFLSMRFADENFKKVLYTYIASCQYSMEDYASAYKSFKQGLNPYDSSTSEAIFYKFAFSAFIEGETDEAILLLEMLLYAAPTERSEILQNADELINTLRQQGDETPSFLDGCSLFYPERRKPLILQVTIDIEHGL